MEHENGRPFSTVRLNGGCKVLWVWMDAWMTRPPSILPIPSARDQRDMGMDVGGGWG